MRSLRPFVTADGPILATFLRAEGLAADDMAFDTHTTYVLEEEGVVMGFATLAVAHGLPTLAHFFVARAYRTPARARFLARAVRTLAREAGYARMIVHGCSDPVRRVVEYYFRARPYAFDDGCAYYLVTV